VEDIEILRTDRLAGEMVVEVYSTLHMYPKWRLLCINTCIITDSVRIAGIRVGMVRIMVTMQFMNEWKYSTMVLNSERISWQLFG
jgi:hypothetical protein